MGKQPPRPLNSLAARRSHPVYCGPIVRVPNGPVDQVLHRSFVRRDDWQSNPAEANRYYQEAQNPEVVVTWSPERRPEERYGDAWWLRHSDAVMSEVESQFLQMKEDTLADIFDIAILHWLHYQRPAKACLSLRDICRYRHVKPLDKALRECKKAMCDIRGFRIQTNGIDSQLLEIDSIHPENGKNQGALIYVYSPGAFVAAALSDNRYFVAAFSPRLLHLDPYRQRTAKRLGRYLRRDWRLNAPQYVSLPPSPFKPRYRSWRSHLYEAGIEITDRQFDHPGEFINSLYAALGQLIDVECLAAPPDGMPLKDWVDDVLTHPEDRYALTRRGQLEAFLNRRVHLPPPPCVRDDLAHYAERRISTGQSSCGSSARPVLLYTCTSPPIPAETPTYPGRNSHLSRQLGWLFRAWKRVFPFAKTLRL